MKLMIIPKIRETAQGQFLRIIAQMDSKNAKQVTFPMDHYTDDRKMQILTNKLPLEIINIPIPIILVVVFIKLG